MFFTFGIDSNDELSVIYLVIWIFIGNYVLLNLFLAILLDGKFKILGFSMSNENDDDEI